MINHYEAAMEKFIQAIKETPFPFYKQRQGDIKAIWSDDVCYFQHKNKTRAIIIFFDRYSYNGKGIRSYKAALKTEAKFPLKSYYNEIAKAICIKRCVTLSDKQFKPTNQASFIIKFISWLQNTNILISGITPKIIRNYLSFLKSYNYGDRTIYHIETELLWLVSILQESNVIEDTLSFKRLSESKFDTTSAINKENKKMPKEDSIAALLSVFYDVFPNEKSLFKKKPLISYYDNVRHRYTAGMVVLSLAATQRFAAESSFLAQNMLISRNSENGQTVYSYLFQGSKKYPVNQKHVVGGMYPYIKRVLKYFDIAFEPARVLARFYENPSRPLKEVLGKYSIENYHGCDINKPVNLFQLGGLLNFYNTYPKLAYDKLKNIKGFPFSLDMDKVLNPKSYNGYWFGITDRKSFEKLNMELTPRQLQEKWIANIKSSLPHFPYRVHNNGNKVHLADALVCFTGLQNNTKKSGAYLWAGSPFSIEVIDIATLFYNNLSSAYLVDNGYSNEFAITPNQLRHYNNTIYQRSGVSDEHIAILSGRKDAKQNADYDHRTGEVIAIHLTTHYNKNKDYTYIKDNIVTVQECRELLGRPASDTGVGFCFQNLSQTPCTHLSDFKIHCATCIKAAFCKGNSKAIEAMKEDIVLQKATLQDIYEMQDLHKNSLSRKHFIQKIENVTFYNVLLDLMQDNSIEDGMLLRLVQYKNHQVVFDIFNIHEKKRIGRKVKQLPNIQKMLEDKIIELKKKETKKPSLLVNLLLKNGIKI